MNYCGTYNEAAYPEIFFRGGGSTAHYVYSYALLYVYVHIYTCKIENFSGAGIRLGDSTPHGNARTNIHNVQLKLNPQPFPPSPGYASGVLATMKAHLPLRSLLPSNRYPTERQQATTFTLFNLSPFDLTQLPMQLRSRRQHGHYCSRLSPVLSRPVL